MADGDVTLSQQCKRDIAPVRKMGPRRIHRHKDLLEAMHARRLELNLKQEEVDDLAGVPERYCSKVEAGRFSDKRREAVRKMRGRARPKQPTVRRPFLMAPSVSWLLQAMGLTLVVMPIEMALELDGLEIDPVTEMEKNGEI